MSTYVSPTFFKQKACKWFTANTTKGQTVLLCTVKVQVDWSYIWLKEICHFFKKIYITTSSQASFFKMMCFTCASSILNCIFQVHYQYALFPYTVIKVPKKDIYIEQSYYKTVFLITFMQFTCFLVPCFSSYFSCGDFFCPPPYNILK